MRFHKLIKCLSRNETTGEADGILHWIGRIATANGETLLQFYDRLQQRKLRRMQWRFYAKATEEKLADLVLHYLDKEIEDAEKLS